MSNREESNIIREQNKVALEIVIYVELQGPM